MEAVKKSHIRGILNEFKAPTQSISKTMPEADEQSSKCFSCKPVFFLLSNPPLYHIFPLIPVCPLLLEREACNIEDLTDLLAEDWFQLGNTHEMGEKTAKFIPMELENTWGSKHLAVFDEEEAHNWILGVSTALPIQCYASTELGLEVVLRGCELHHRPRVRPLIPSSPNSIFY